MEKPKTKVVKSKSSNSAIPSKSESRRNKKTRSNAGFQPLLLKKRGVYVEKKEANLSIDEQDIAAAGLSDPLNRPSSPRLIRRPSKKRFLNSVLTILSQSTTGTQYPDQDDPDTFKKVEKTKSKIKKKNEDVILEDSTSSANNSKKKPKYRSRILNSEDSELEQLVVLQSTKEIIHTPSNHSNKSQDIKTSATAFKASESIKWADILPPLVTTLDVPTPKEMTINNDQVESNETKDKLKDKDPSTLVAEVPKKEDKKFYNFFVDLLETTFNVYNVQTEFNVAPTSSINSSKVALEIDECVAKKLNIPKIKEPASEDVTGKSSLHYFHSIQPNTNESWDYQQLLEHFQPKYVQRTRALSPAKSIKKKQRLKSESFEHKKSKPLPKSSSSTAPRKSLRKDRKKNFIKLLKKQLEMDDDAFDEPQNFFQALKVIARNKRHCQKSIHCRFDKSSEGDVHECQFKRRKVLSSSTKSRSRKSKERDVRPKHSSIASDITSSPNKRNTITITETSEIEIEASDHSLEVFGYDYEPSTKKNPVNFPSFPPSASTSMQDYNINQALIMRYTDSDASSFLGSPSHIAPKYGLRSLSGLIK